MAPGFSWLAPQWQCIPHRKCLGATAKVGLWTSSETWALVRETPNKFLTHLPNCVAVVTEAVAGVGANAHVWELFEWPSLVCWHNWLNLLGCLVRMVLCLHSLTFFIHSLHSLYNVMLTWSLSTFIYVFLKFVHISMVLLMDLTHSFASCFSALSKILTFRMYWCYYSILNH